MNTKGYFVYILMNTANTVLYIGVTNNLIRRVYEHKNKLAKGFTEKYSLDKLVYFESFNSIQEAIRREKQLKNWTRAWKEDLIKKGNPKLTNLYFSL